LTVCGETYRVSRGGNSTGVRYAWHAAEEFVMKILTDNGLSHRAAHSVYEQWSDYPHRCLKVIEDGLAGNLPDPKMHVLLGPYEGGSPIRCEVADNDAATYDRRAHRPCPCGEGTLFDWGCGWNGYTNWISWRCNRCPDKYEEYVTHERLGDIRRKFIGEPATTGATESEAA
jgi:hypothetical protein